MRAAIKVKASVIICFTSSGRAAKLIAKYRPTMPVLSIVIPRLQTNQLRWTFTGAFEVKLCYIVTYVVQYVSYKFVVQNMYKIESKTN